MKTLKNKKQITLADIAERIGVSKVTVSKALREHSDISEKMIDLVKKIAEEMDYTPNLLARNLSARNTRTIGLVVPRINHDFFAEAIESIYFTARKNKYEIVMTVSQESAEEEIEHIRSLMAMKVDGLLISITEKTRDTAIFRDIKKRGLPLIFFFFFLEGLGFNCLVSDDERGAAEITGYAIEKGYKKIGHIGGHKNSNIGKARYKGFIDALKYAGLEVREDYIQRGGFAIEDGYNGFMSLYENKSLPEIIFTVTYPVALGVYRAAREVGLVIPEDVDVISFGDSAYNEFLQPSITGIHMPAAEIGKKAVELVIDQIEDKTPIEDKKIIMPVQINVGQTCIKRGLEND